MIASKMLFTPMKIGRMEVKNRIVFAPMGTHYDASDSTITERSIDYYAARAKGGVGAIIVGAVAIDPIGRGGRGVPGLWEDKFIPGWRQLADAVHAGGGKVLPQLFHAGRQTFERAVGGQVVSSSPIPCPVCKNMPHELTVEEIEDLVEKFGEAAVRARKAGCDGVELHGAHGYLIAQFMSPRTNKRTDEYGGTLEDRLRFALEIVNSIKRKAGEDFPVIFRISAEEMVSGGHTINESMICAPLLVDGGVDALHITRGVIETVHWEIPPQGTPIGLNVPLAEAIKKVVGIPVIAVGRIPDPTVAEQVLQAGKADLIALGRPLIVDPDWPRLAVSGNFDDIRPCIYCNECLGRVLRANPLACTLNAAAGKEKEMDITPAAVKKKVLIAGGGPAGLEAARVAALRGHQVTIYDSADKLGGQLGIAAIPPVKQDLAKAIKYLSTQVGKLGIKVELGKAVTPSVVDELKPDVLIVATGAIPQLPDIPGVTGARVVTAHDVLAGKVALHYFDDKLRAVMGNRVIIIGGGTVGAETADYAGERGAAEIYLLEMLPDIALDMTPSNREFLIERLAAHNVKVVTSATVRKILDDGVVFLRDGKEETIHSMDNIIVAAGVRSVDELSGVMKDKVAEVYVVGDARGPRKAMEAIAEGAETGCKI